jgi:hypothetical protein
MEQRCTSFLPVTVRPSLSLLLLYYTMLKHTHDTGVLEMSYDAYTWDYAVIDAGLRGIHVTMSLDRFARLIALLNTCFLTAGEPWMAWPDLSGAVSDDPEVLIITNAIHFTLCTIVRWSSRWNSSNISNACSDSYRNIQYLQQQRNCTDEISQLADYVNTRCERPLMALPISHTMLLNNTAQHTVQQQNPMPSSADPVGIPAEDEEVALHTTCDSPYRVSDTPQGADVRDDVSDAGSSSSSSSDSSDSSSSSGCSEGTYTGGEEALRATLALAAAAAAAAPAAPYLRFGQLRMALRCRLADTALLLPQSSTAIANTYTSTITNARRSSDTSSSAGSVGGNCLALCLEGQVDVHSGLDDETAAVDITRCALLPVVFGCDGGAAARVLANRCEVSHVYECIKLLILYLMFDTAHGIVLYAV